MTGCWPRACRYDAVSFSANVVPKRAIQKHRRRPVGRLLFWDDRQSILYGAAARLTVPPATVLRSDCEWLE